MSSPNMRSSMRPSEWRWLPAAQTCAAPARSRPSRNALRAGSSPRPGARSIDPGSACRTDRAPATGESSPVPLLRSRSPAGALFHRLSIELGDIFPVDQMVDERLQIIRPAVAVIDIIGVFPHIDAEDRRCALDQRAFPVRRLRYDDLAVLDREPSPARAELSDAG